MADKHPLISIIATSAVFSAGVFVSLQYVQVLPLDREIVKLKEQLRNQNDKIKISREYQELNDLYAQQKARAELLQEELKNSVGIGSDLVKTQIKLDAAQKAVTALSKNGDYNQLSSELKQAKSSLSQYKSKSKYNQALSDIDDLKKQLSLKRELDSLVKKREDIEEIIDCMLHGCANVFHAKYNKKYEQVAYEQYDTQLKAINKQIESLYSNFK